MKNILYFLFGFIILLLPAPSLSQEREKPFIVSPFIGDTLSLEERDYYNLLPTINGFQFAIFYLDQDSLLDVKVYYKTFDMIRDTIISNYKSVDKLKIYLLKRDIANRTEVMVYLENNTRITGSFLSINHDSVLIYSEECNEGTLSSNCFTKINNTEINKIVIPGKSNVGKSVVWCTIIGIATGSAIGLVINESTNGWDEFNAASALAGGLVGSCIGLLTGLIYGSITSTPDITIQPISDENIKGLSQYAIFPSGEPDELKKIK